jgi:hypothetical protein
MEPGSGMGFGDIFFTVEVIYSMATEVYIRYGGLCTFLASEQLWRTLG